MPEVEKTSSGLLKVRDVGTFSRGDRADVPTAAAQYLVEERGDFEYVEDADDEANTEDDADDGSEGGDERTVDELLEDGECPWCDDYEGDAVGRHASSAHSDEWDAYKED